MSKPPLVQDRLNRAIVRGATAAIFRFAVIVLAASWGEKAARAEPRVAPAPEYRDVARHVRRVIFHELARQSAPAIWIALVDDQRLVWAEGFGEADPETGAPANADSLCRVGSVSKLFTDLAVMQLVEQGKVDLDAPVVRYLPDFRPHNPFANPPTLRHLMAHRAGLVRESPVGSYFDPEEPTLDATIASLNATRLVFAPGRRVKYSNAGISVVGQVLERAAGEPFTAALRRRVLAPLGMNASSFTLDEAPAELVARGQMWTYEGRTYPAPTFDLGIAPAGNLYASPNELALFVQMLFAGGQGQNGRLVAAETLERMYEPQFQPESASGFGLGFFASRFAGRRRVGHGGAVYGFATSVAALVDDKLGAIVIANRDVANGLTDRIGDLALDLMLKAKAGAPLPEPPLTDAVPNEMARRLAGVYRHGERIVELIARPGRLWLDRNVVRVDVRLLDGRLIVDDVQGYGTRLEPRGEDAIVIDGEEFVRLPAKIPSPPPDRRAALIGEYGWDHNTLFVLERHGKLYALIEWFFAYPLTEVAPDLYAFPDYGLYHDEHVKFIRDERGRATAAIAAGITFARRDPGGAKEGDAATTFRITPLRPVAELLSEALAATPPVEQGEFKPADLVDLAVADEHFHFDIRYATADNFLGVPVYQKPRAFLQRPAAEALVRVQRRLEANGFGLVIHDAYRPWHITKVFWEATPSEHRRYVADPARGSRHNRGAAVDVSLYEMSTGRIVDMPSGYDEFSPRAWPDYPGGDARSRALRELLRDNMEAEGFSVYEHEWWHFDYRDWRQYAIGNYTFDNLSQGRPANQ